MRFIPEFHFDKPSQKLTKEWCNKVVHYHYYNNDNRSLLDGKKVSEIETFASGEFDMKPFIRMFTSLRKKMDSIKNQDGVIDSTNWNDSGIDFSPLPLIPQKLNSAKATVEKQPVEVSCIANDALAMKKMKEDLTFLKNKALIEEELQSIADELLIGKVDLGTTKHSSIKYSEAPMGLDLSKPDEEDVFVKLLYSLAVQTSFEKALQLIYDLKKAVNVRTLEIQDQLKFGVSVHRAFNSAITGLPDAEYVFPGDIAGPKSKLPDYSDQTHRIIHKSITIMELFNYFGNEIGGLEDLEKIINEKETGYCSCNKIATIGENNWGTAKLEIKYFEVKSVDWVGVYKRPNSKQNATFLTEDEGKATEKLWAQNTYGFWWLVNTKHFFGIHRLPFSHRTKGKESYQNFSTNIFKSQPKSAVELSIGENKKAQIADIKMQHALVMSRPAGMYIDLKFLRGAISGLKDAKDKYTMDGLISNIFERNLFIGDSEDFDGKNDGQLKPFMEIPGGLKSEVTGYIQTIVNADQNIANFTGINPQLTGQSANPEGLVGLQKLLINSSINAIDYINEAIRIQYESLFNIWANCLQASIEAGGKVKDGIVNYIGIDDTELLDALNEAPLHNLTIKVEVVQREEERHKFQVNLDALKVQGIISAVDEYLISGIRNVREKMAVLAVKEKKWKQEQEKIRAENYQNQQQIAQQQGTNMVQREEAAAQGKLNEIYAKGDVQKNLITLGAQIGMSEKQMEGMIKKALQKDRNLDQMEKNIRTIQAKQQAKAQEAFA